MNLLSRFALAALLLLLPCKALATCNSVYTFQLANGTVADATQVMSNYNQVMGCATSVDNTQIGVLGIFASQLKPTTIGQATFGGTVAYTFANQLQVNSGADGVISELVFGHSITQSQPIAQFWNFPSGTELLDIGPTGTETAQTSTDSSVGEIINGAPDNGQTASLLSIFKKSGGTQLMQFLPGGCLQVAPTINATNTLGCVAPIYDNTGASLGATFHWMFKVFTAVDLTGCNGALGCTVSLGTLSGSAVFTNNQGFCLILSWPPNKNAEAVLQTLSTGTAAQGQLQATNGATMGTFTNSNTVPALCWGT